MSSLYGYAYSMADMTLVTFEPGTVIATTTSTPRPTGTLAGNESGPGSGNTNATQPPSNNNNNRPTKEPNPNQPTKKPKN
jgi:hypothetical protein